MRGDRRVALPDRRTAKPALVLIPGWRMTADVWPAQLASFSLLGVDRTPALAKLDRPALVIAAAGSSALKAMAARLPGGRLELVADAGHAVFIDQPERFVALVRAFLDGLDRD